jgi:hypothetical protein
MKGPLLHIVSFGVGLVLFGVFFGLVWLLVKAPVVLLGIPLLAGVYLFGRAAVEIAQGK